MHFFSKTYFDKVGWEPQLFSCIVVSRRFWRFWGWSTRSFSQWCRRPSASCHSTSASSFHLLGDCGNLTSKCALCLFRWAQRVTPHRFADAVIFALYLYHRFFMIMDSNRSPWRRWQMLRCESMHIVCLIPDWIVNLDGLPYFVRNEQ